MDYAALLRSAQRTPTGVKDALPIAFVMEQAGFPVAEVDDDGRLHCLCPFHDDSAPSFDIFGERWGCYPCGLRGDVLDLLRQFAPEMPFGQVMDWAEDLIRRMPEGWAQEAKAEYRKREFDPVRALTRVENTTNDFILESICEHYGWPPADWLHSRWRVGAEWNQVIIPYYRRDMSLAGFKRRGIDTKALSAPGAKLCLYGEWLDQDPSKPVLLCEGESDAWIADRAVGDVYAVLGVPGAATPPDCRGIAGRTVIIAFDADEAGRRGAGAWRDALVGRGDVSTWNLPAGQDIRSYLQGRIEA